ncbi:MAG: hypothetical protein QOJ35_158 [Solirubrobacteraceae bacterium]|jgi:hypothetical protein|nr:hypothetical protein [Solirubrobacteraceae bacterium]
MTSPRSRVLRATILTATGCLLLGGTVAAALTLRAPAPQITASGVGAVRLGRTYSALHAAGRVGRIGPACELKGPGSRSATLRAPLTGWVDLTRSAPRRVRVIAIRSGAKARGVGVGSSQAQVTRAFPKAVVDHSTDKMFGITLVKVPKAAGGSMAFAISTRTKKVTLVGVPHIEICE